MKKKTHTPEQIVLKLRKAQALLAEGKTVKEICRVLEVSEQTYYKWKRQYGDMPKSDVKRLKELEKENERLKKIVADLTIDKSILEEFIKGKY